MQLLLKLENMTSRVASSNETSLFAELEMLSQSLSVDSFTNQPTQPVTVGTQVSLAVQSPAPFSYLIIAIIDLLYSFIHPVWVPGPYAP